MTQETDRELLELSAKAAGFVTHPKIKSKDCVVVIDKNGYCGDEHAYWNPLTDDGDALRLAVKLGLLIATAYGSTACGLENGRGEISEFHGADPCAATRRAIVRAAAEIGKKM